MNVINQGETDLQKTREAEEKLEVNNFNTGNFFWTVKLRYALINSKLQDPPGYLNFED